MKQDACTFELVPFAAIDPPALVALINDAYLRYEILAAPRPGTSVIPRLRWRRAEGLTP